MTYNNAMEKASINGHLSIVKILSTAGANSYNICLELASEYGFIEIVKLMIVNSTNEARKKAKTGARSGGRMDIYDFIANY